MNFRNKERLFESRLKTLKCSLHYFILVIKEIIIVKFKIKNFTKTIKENTRIISSLTIHDYNLKKADQKQYLVLKAINSISKDYGFKDIFQERKFISNLISSNPNSLNIFLIFKLIIIIFNLFIQFFCSDRFLENLQN